MGKLRKGKYYKWTMRNYRPHPLPNNRWCIDSGQLNPPMDFVSPDVISVADNREFIELRVSEQRQTAAERKFLGRIFV